VTHVELGKAGRGGEKESPALRSLGSTPKKCLLRERSRSRVFKKRVARSACANAHREKIPTGSPTREEEENRRGTPRGMEP